MVCHDHTYIRLQFLQNDQPDCNTWTNPFMLSRILEESSGNHTSRFVILLQIGPAQPNPHNYCNYEHLYMCCLGFTTPKLQCCTSLQLASTLAWIGQVTTTTWCAEQSNASQVSSSTNVVTDQLFCKMPSYHRPRSRCTWSMITGILSQFFAILAGPLRINAEMQDCYTQFNRPLDVKGG